MAIPFNLPSDEETEDTYRRIDQLLLDLYDLLRQIVLRQQAVPREQRHTETARVVPTESRLAPREPRLAPREHRLDSRLPDIVVDALPLVRKPPRTTSRRRRRSSEKPTRRYHHVSTPYDDGRSHSTPSPAVTTSSWLNVGIELRQIAEEITFISRNGNETTTKRRNEIKASSLFSLLVPAPVTGTFWTTVIILVGWRLLTKQR